MKTRVIDSIPLSTKLRKVWSGSDVIIVSTDDALLVKRIQKASPPDVRRVLKTVGKKLTSKDITHAIQAARA